VTTLETLELIWTHDILVIHKITEPMTYIDIRVKLQTDLDFVEYLQAYRKLLIKDDTNPSN
jgi:hypothetical protein